MTFERRFTRRTGEICHAAITDLRKSGLSDEIIIEAGIELFHGKADDLKKALGFSKINDLDILRTTSLVQFPYYREDGTVEFCRYKPTPQIDPDRKYLHPKGAPPIPYIIPRVWAVKEKTNVPIWITEGEKKALKVNQSGRHCIALPGIWGFKAGKNSRFEDGSKDLWKQLKAFSWTGRCAYLAFDSDVFTNPQVRSAVLELAVKLISLGAIVKFVVWDEGKGIDDYLVTQADPAGALLALEKVAQVFDVFVKPEYQSEAIRAVAVVQLSQVRFEQLVNGLAKILKVKTSAIKAQIKHFQRGDEIPTSTLDDFFERFILVYPSEFAFDQELSRPVKIRDIGYLFPDYTEIWRKSTGKKVIQAEQIVFKPDGAAAGELNLFRGLPLQEKVRPGKCEKILELARHLTNNDPGLFHWLMCWLAYPLQHIGAKMYTAFVLHGGQGVGKNLFFDMIGRFYGDYYSYVTQDVLNEQYNSWASGKLFIMCNEVLANRAKAEKKNLLKSYVTEDTISIRVMYQERRKEENHCNFVFLSNDAMPILIEEDDRRYTICVCHNKLERSFYDEVKEEMNGDGEAAFLNYLLNYNLGSFRAHEQCYDTDAKRDLAELCEDGFSRFLKLWQAGQTDLPFCTCTVADLYRACSLWIQDNGEYLPGGATAFGQRISTFIARGILKDCVAARFYMKNDVAAGKKQERGLIIDATPEGFSRGSMYGDLKEEMASFFRVRLDKFVKQVGEFKP